MNQAHAPPGKGRHFYTLLWRADGLVDVYLDPRVYSMTPGDEADFDFSFKVVRGIDPACYDDMEAHIREHYKDWCDTAEVVWM